MEVYLCRAKMSDLAEILAMSYGIYGGYDYLPHTLPYWLSEPEDVRHNHVLKVRGTDRIVGFVTEVYEPGNKRAYSQALRIDKSLQGQGLGVELQIQHMEHLLQINPDLALAGTMGTTSWTLEAMQHPIQGRVTSQRSLVSIPNILLHEAASSKLPQQIQLEGISVEQLRKVLTQSNEIKQRIMPHEYIMLNWVPYHLDAFDKIAIMRTATIVLADNIGHPQSVSVLSMPFPVPSGGYVGAIDLFVNTSDELRQHLGELLRLVCDNLRVLGATKCRMQVFSEVPQDGTVRAILKEFGMEAEPEEHQVWSYEKTIEHIARPSL